MDVSTVPVSAAGRSFTSRVRAALRSSAASCRRPSTESSSSRIAATAASSRATGPTLARSMPATTRSSCPAYQSSGARNAVRAASSASLADTA